MYSRALASCEKNSRSQGRSIPGNANLQHQHESPRSEPGTTAHSLDLLARLDVLLQRVAASKLAQNQNGRVFLLHGPEQLDNTSCLSAERTTNSFCNMRWLS